MNEQTRNMIASMLKENTGRHFLDSGDFYGRHWQANQHREFEAEPATLLSFKYEYVEMTHNLYHWLVERLEYNERVDNFFRAWANGPEQEDKSWYQSMYDFVEWLKEPWINPEEGLDPSGKPYITEPLVGGMYGEGDAMVINTYNHENLLSQTIQFTYFTIEDAEVIDDGIYVMLQIHGGADVRGGYTAPRIFQPNYYEEGMLDSAYGQVTCPHCGKTWRTDDAYHWYDEDEQWPEANRLDQHEMQEVEPAVYPSVTEGIIRAHAALNEILVERNSRVPRTLITDEHDGWCPACGCGVLEAY